MPLPLHYLCPFSPLLCLYQIEPRWLQFPWKPSDTDTCDTDRQIMLYLSTGTVSCLGPRFMAQSQQTLYSHPHEPGHASGSQYLIFPSLHCQAMLSSMTKIFKASRHRFSLACVRFYIHNGMGERPDSAVFHCIISPLFFP